MAHWKSGKLEVSDYIFYSAFILGSILLYLPALWAKFALSGDNYSVAKCYGYFLYVFICAIIHWNYLENGYVPFIGKKDTSIMGWLSMLMILAYFFTTPAPWKSEHRFLKKQRAPMKSNDNTKPE
jgi:hypothetical protein